MMLRTVGAVAALALVLLPIGAGSIMLPPDVSPAWAEASSAAPAAAPNGVPEPTALAFLCLGGAGVLVRRAAARRRARS